MTIRRFVYLDETALDQYIAPAEGGSVTEMQSKSGRSGTGGAKLKIGVGEGQIGGDRKNENTWTVTDTPPARFARLLDTLDGEPDWHIIEHPDRQLPEVHTGNLISRSCDVHIPDASNALARSGDGTKALDMGAEDGADRRGGRSRRPAVSRKVRERQAGSHRPD
jgi:hypothetical protein